MRISALGDPPRDERDRELRLALETYIAGHFRGTISDPAAWSSMYARAAIPEPWRGTAEGIIAARPHPSERDLAEATALVRPVLEAMEPPGSQYSPLMAPFIALAWAWIVAILSLACALLFRGGLAFFILGIAVVRRDGSRASRPRVFWRGLAAWLPLLALLIPLRWLTSVAMPSVRETSEPGLNALLVWALYVPLVIWSTLRPERGLQDRVAGTWLVPR
jgi:hypothetical protein